MSITKPEVGICLRVRLDWRHADRSEPGTIGGTRGGFL